MEVLAYIDKTKQQQVKYINKGILLAYTADTSSREAAPRFLNCAPCLDLEATK